MIGINSRCVKGPTGGAVEFEFLETKNIGCDFRYERVKNIPMRIRILILSEQWRKAVVNGKSKILGFSGKLAALGRSARDVPDGRTERFASSRQSRSLRRVLALDGEKKRESRLVPAPPSTLLAAISPYGGVAPEHAHKLTQVAHGARAYRCGPKRACTLGVPVSWPSLSLAQAGLSPPLLAERDYAPKLEVERSERKADRESDRQTLFYQKTMRQGLLGWFIHRRRHCGDG
jgi:hypothetical protein